MREKGNFFPSYYHQYRVDVGEQKTVRPFVEVDKSYYKKNQPYLGMVLTAKTADGAVSTTPFPNGYQYVGNSQYGRWRDNSSGGSMWEFYGKYMLMSQVMNWGGFGLSRNHYNNYASYHSTGRPYYGPKREYGTAGTVTQKQKPNFYKRKMAHGRKAASRIKLDNAWGGAKIPLEAAVSVSVNDYESRSNLIFIALLGRLFCCLCSRTSGVYSFPAEL